MQTSDLLDVTGAAVLIAIIIQLIKEWVPEKLIPHAAVGIGIVVVLIAQWTVGAMGKPDVVNSILTGILAGASASGLYSIQKPLGLLKGKGP